MNGQKQFDALINEALAQELVGWDFRWLHTHAVEEPLPWEYSEIVRSRMLGITSLLDVGTGGGEMLASLAPLPPDTWATEGYPPNAITARRRLEPLGVKVIDTSDPRVSLPFPDASFDLVIDRHTGCDFAKLYCFLRRNGRYVTQQVGGENCFELNQFFQEVPYYPYADDTLENYVRGLEANGFRILNKQEAFPAFTFHDIAGVVFYLKVIPWQIQDFSVERYHSKLWDMHQIIRREGSFSVKAHRFLIEAVKQ